MDGASVTPERPGDLIKRLMADRDWSQAELAFVLGIPAASVNQMIHSKRAISPEMAKLLGLAFDMPAEVFAEAQARWSLHTVPDPDPEVRARAYAQSNFPLREMARRGWINDPTKGNAHNELCRFFGVNSLEAASGLAHAAKRTGSEIKGSQLAWLYRVRALAREMIVPRYSRSNLERAIQQMATMREAPEEIRHIPRLLNEAGVRFVIVEGLPGGRIDGVCTWLDGRDPVIGMSLRCDRIDNFWFVLRHECAHVLHGHGKTSAIIDSDISLEAQDVDLEERVANEEAADFCVPQVKVRSFYLRKKPLFTDGDIQAFAKINQVHPGLVVGQLHNLTKQFTIFRHHLVSIRKFILPSALADGWGSSVTVS